MLENVFVNRILNMKKVRYIGLDMDHTLVRYHTKAFESEVYKLATERLVEQKQYPEQVKRLQFNFNDAIRGLVIDSKHGNILKLSRFNAIRQSKHGTSVIKYSEQKQLYRSRYVDLKDPNYMAIDTSFSIAFCVLYGQLVDLYDQDPNACPNYETMAQDLLHTVDEIHSDPQFKQRIGENVDKYIITDPALVANMERYLRYGKKFFIITNSNYQYTDRLLEFAITPFLSDKQRWQDLFEFVVTLTNKPRFFYDDLPFLAVNPVNGSMSNTFGSLQPGIYQGGNAAQLTQALNCKDDEILYIGDHIYGDILRLKKACNWHTALVVEELGEEISAQKKALPLEKEISRMMSLKKELEHILITQHAQHIEKQVPQDLAPNSTQEKLTEIDEKIASYLREQQLFFNSNWGRIFRAGAEESYFAYQVERYACIYMEKLSDLLEYSPLTYFRPYHRALPHDTLP